MSELTHIDARGQARMVGVGHKPSVVRRAVAEGRVLVSPDTAGAILEGRVPKGDVGAVARLAGIAAAKRTPELVFLCHPLPIDGAAVEVDISPEGVVTLTATVETTARTGVEMEALTAVSVAALNVYDLVKGIDPGPVIEGVRLVEKRKTPAS
ncbi:MAG: cyclic pyranopterin monophosphate synthase MoaC [Thermoleophilia bacterium]